MPPAYVGWRLIFYCVKYSKRSLCSIAEKGGISVVYLEFTTYLHFFIFRFVFLFFFHFVVLFDSFQFRRAVSDITKPHHDDYYLIRWLNGTIYTILLYISACSTQTSMKFVWLMLYTFLRSFHFRSTQLECGGSRTNAARGKWIRASTQKVNPIKIAQNAFVCVSFRFRIWTSLVCKMARKMECW